MFNKIRNAAIIGTGLVLGTLAHAQTSTIADAQEAMSDGLTTVGTIAGVAAVLSAGVVVFLKVKKYFNRAG